MSSTTSTYFYALTIRKQLPGNDFERSGRGQEPSRGHKFSILENFLSIRDFTSQTLASFLSDLVGACLPQTLLRSECDIIGTDSGCSSVLSFPFFLRDKPKQRCVEPRQRNDEPRHNHTTAIELSFPLMKLISEAIYNRAEAA